MDMTRDEAIAELKYIAKRMIDYTEGYAAIFMAIEALSEPSVPQKQPLGVVKEYPNGMVAMCYETYKEYNDIAVREAVRERREP